MRHEKNWGNIKSIVIVKLPSDRTTTSRSHHTGKVTLPRDEQERRWIMELTNLRAENKNLRAENMELTRELAELLVKNSGQRKQYEHLLDAHLKDEPAISLDNFIDTYLTDDEKKQLTQSQEILKDQWRQLVESGQMSKIKYYRLLNNMDQKALADKMAMKQSNISRLEQVGYKPRIKTLENLAATFNISPKDLI